MTLRATLRGGVDALLKQNGVDVVYEHAVYLGEGKVQAGGKQYEGKDVLLACGSKPLVLPIPRLQDNPLVITSDEFLSHAPDFQFIFHGSLPLSIQKAKLDSTHHKQDHKACCVIIFHNRKISQGRKHLGRIYAVSFQHLIGKQIGNRIAESCPL